MEGSGGIMPDPVEVIEVQVVFEFDVNLLKKLSRLDLINSIQSQIDFAVADVVQEIEGCLTN